MNPSTIEALKLTFISTASPDLQTRKNGEKQLELLSRETNYSLLLLQFIDQSRNNFELQLRASISLKNWSSSLKHETDYFLKYLDEILPNLQIMLIQSLVLYDKKISLQLSETITNLATIYFPRRWMDLTTHFVTYFESGDMNKIWISLKTLTAITENSRFINELNNCLCSKLIQNFLRNISGSNAIQCLNLLKLSLKLFYHLNSQDLHPKFEENLSHWMGFLKQILTLQLDLTDDLPLFKCKGEAMRSILLYATKYREDVETLIQSFSQEIWAVCVNTSNDPKYEKMVLNSLKYFKSLVTWKNMSGFFSSNINSLFESLLIPQSKITNLDAQTFEDEPQNLIDVFFENSELNSKKAINVELLRTVCRIFPGEKTVKTGGQNLEAEIMLCNLLVDGLTVAYRPIDGVTQTTLSTELVVFFYENVIKPALGKYNNNIANCNSLHVSFLFRFIFFFRNYIPQNDLAGLVTYTSQFLLLKEEYLKLATAYTIEGILNTKMGDLNSYGNMMKYFNKENSKECIKPALGNLIQVLNNSNLDCRYLKCLATIVCLIEENCSIYCDNLLELYEILYKKLISQGYTFANAILIFDGFAFAIAYSLKGDKRLIQKVESKMVFLLKSTMQKNVQEMLAFVVQLFAVIIDFSEETNTDSINSIFNSILCPENWIPDNEAIIPAYLTFLQTYFKYNPNALTGCIQNIASIFSCLNKTNQFHNFSRLSLALNQGVKSFQQLHNFGIIQLILSEIFTQYKSLCQQKQSFDKAIFVKEMVLMICSWLEAFEVIEVISICNTIIPDFITSFFIQETEFIRSFNDRINRKLVFIGLIKLLFHPQGVSNLPGDFWISTFRAMLDNIHLKRDIRYRKRFLDTNTNGWPYKVPNANSNTSYVKLGILTFHNKPGYTKLEEDSEFVNAFKGIYQTPVFTSKFNMVEQLSLTQQEYLTKLIREGII